MTKIIIDHERYGDRSEFDSIASAQAAIRECGDEFASVTLTILCADVIDERGEVVGRVDSATTYRVTLTDGTTFTSETLTSAISAIRETRPTAVPCDDWQCVGDGSVEMRQVAESDDESAAIIADIRRPVAR